jgi:hypothetical protein
LTTAGKSSWIDFPQEELEAPVGVAQLEPADLHKVQPGDDLPAGAGRGPALTGWNKNPRPFI